MTQQNRFRPLSGTWMKKLCHEWMMKVALHAATDSPLGCGQKGRPGRLDVFHEALMRPLLQELAMVAVTAHHLSTLLRR